MSLIFTGITVSVLSGPAPECAQIIQGTIAAAAVINEIIAVIISKKGFESGEFGKSVHAEEENTGEQQELPIINISRQHGSGGREIGKNWQKNWIFRSTIMN